MTRAAPRWRGVARSLFSRPSGAIGTTLVLAHVLLAAASPWIVPYDFKAISAAMILDAPSAAHWLGTDQLGRDVLTRTAMGGRQAIVVTAIATPLAVAWGGILGIYLGLAGGRRARASRAARAAASAARVSSASRPSGFWQNTASPCSSAAIVWAVCNALGVAMTTPSSGCASIAARSAKTAASGAIARAWASASGSGSTIEIGRAHV